MCNNHKKHNPVRCIIPPYMNDKLMNDSDKEFAKKAMESNIQAIKIRAKREFISHLIANKKKNLLVTNAKTVNKPTLRMEVYNIKHSTQPSAAEIIWQNGKIIQPLDKDAKNVIRASNGTWDVYYNLFGRNSLDNLGLVIKHYIHYGNTDDDMDNAMWDGEAMFYGDGDGKIFGSFTNDIDVIGHELTHGVTQYESNLKYENQSGALNESLSDVFGIMIKQKMLNLDFKKSNWLIGENVLLGNQYALRSMCAPGTAYKNHPDLGDDPQPATMNQFLKMPNTERGDWGGVHYNSGIPNFAFYVTAYNLKGFSWEKAGKIWYAAMTDKALKNNATFEDFKTLTIKHATKLFKTGSNELKAVISGWKAANV